MKAIIFVLAIATVFAATNAQAVSITINATAAEAGRVVDAKTFLEGRIGRSITNEEFVKYATRILVIQLLRQQRADTQHTDGMNWESGLRGDFPDPLPVPVE